MTYSPPYHTHAQTHIVYKKRYPELVWIEGCIAVLVTLFVWPVFAYYCNYNFSGKRVHFNLIPHESHEVVNRILFVCYPFLGHAITCIEACRLWLMYYKINYINSVLNNDWRAVVDNSSVLNDWYLHNIKTYGNYKWVCTRWFGYYLFAATASMIIMQTHGFLDWTQFVDLCCYLVPILTCVVLQFKLWRNNFLVHDKFWFYYEFTTTNIVYSIAFIFYLLDQIIYIFDWYIAVSFAVFIHIFGLSIVSIISALWIPKLILNDEAWRRESGELSIRVLSPVTRSLSTSTSTKPEMKPLVLSRVLANKTYTGYFVRHLVKEFSVCMSIVYCTVYVRIYFRLSACWHILRCDSLRIICTCNLGLALMTVIIMRSLRIIYRDRVSFIQPVALGMRQATAIKLGDGRICFLGFMLNILRMELNLH